jgi:hypothetical protein
VKTVASIFVAVHALLALGMVALGVHGSSWLPLSAGIYLAAVVALVAWAAVRHSWRFLLTAGVVMLAVPPAVVLLLDGLERSRYEARLAGTRVSELRDEPIVSGAGRPIGVRLSFAVSVPQSGSFAISPSLYGAEGLYMNATQRLLDGRADAWEYQAGRTHRQSAELYPPILMRAPDGTRCLSRFLPTLPAGREAAPLRVVIHDTPFEGRTGHAYNLAQLYRNVIAERLEPCKSAL